jgi:hypothetical protein
VRMHCNTVWRVLPTVGVPFVAAGSSKHLLVLVFPQQGLDEVRRS